VTYESQLSFAQFVRTAAAASTSVAGAEAPSCSPARCSSMARSIHVDYAETVLPVRDGLMKQEDLPKDLGGTGTIVPE